MNLSEKQPVKQAVMLAAGLGVRLGGVPDDRPKGFLQFGERPIVEESVRKLIAVGMEEVFIVTGYRKEYFESLERAYPQVRLVENPAFATTGTMDSLACPAGEVSGSVLVVEADLIYEKRALNTTLNSGWENCILVSEFTGAGDEVFVGVEAERIVCLSKQRSDMDQVAGELVGISLISHALYSEMVDRCRMRDEGAGRFDYEQCLTELKDSFEIGYEKMDDLVWGEIDDERHLERARAIYPEILKKDRLCLENQPD